MNPFEDEEYKEMVNRFNFHFAEYQRNNKKLYFEMFKQGYMKQLEYKGKHYYKCDDRQVLITNLN
jgi:hypothetical protein